MGEGVTHHMREVDDTLVVLQLELRVLHDAGGGAAQHGPPMVLLWQEDVRRGHHQRRRAQHRGACK